MLPSAPQCLPLYFCKQYCNFCSLDFAILGIGQQPPPCFVSRSLTQHLTHKQALKTTLNNYINSFQVVVPKISGACRRYLELKVAITRLMTVYAAPWQKCHGKKRAWKNDVMKTWYGVLFLFNVCTSPISCCWTIGRTNSKQHQYRSNHFE